MAHIIPIRDLKNTANISELCNTMAEPIFVTKNGYGDMVIMNMQVYNRIAAQLDLVEKLKVADKQIEEGAAQPAEDVFKRLKARYE